MKEFFIYNGGVTVPAGAQATFSIPIGADADFILERFSLDATSDACTIQITDAQGKQWFNRPIPVRHIAGNYAANSRPNTLKNPKLIKRNNIITIDLLDSSGAPNIVSVSFEGQKQYE